MGVHYGRLASFVFAVCCCMAVVSIVNVAFATTRTEAMYGTMSNGKVQYKSAAQMRLDMMHNYSFQRVPDQIARYVPKNKTFTPSYTSAQLANMVKGVGKNTLGWAAVAGAVAASGWAIDELTGQITKENIIEGDALSGINPAYLEDAIFDSNGQIWFDVSSLGQTATQSCLNAYNSLPKSTQPIDTFTVSSQVCVGGNYINLHKRTSPISSISRMIFFTNSGSTPLPSPVNTTVSEPVSDAEFNTEVLPKFLGLPNSQIETAINSTPQSTELSDMLRDWLQDVADRSPDLTFDPATKSLTYTDPNTGESTELETAQPDYTQDGTESFTDNQPVELPAACDWFPQLCEWLDWTQQFEEPVAEEMPFEEINLADVQQNFDSGLGSGSCPAPQTTSFMGETITYSFETACYGAETFFKPVLITMGAIMAGFIIVGASRRAV